jgi:hypothetical protein
MIKKFGLYVLCFCWSLYVLSTNVYASEEEITIVIDGYEVEMDVLPEIIGGRVFVPLRFLAEHLGEGIVWDESSNTATVGQLFTHNIGTSTIGMLDDDTIKDINVPSYISKGNTMVSLRLFAEGMYYRVYWGDKRKTIYMYTTPSTKNIHMGELIENNKRKGFERIGFGESRYYSTQEPDYDKKNDALMAATIYNNSGSIKFTYQTVDTYLSGEVNELVKDGWRDKRPAANGNPNITEVFYESSGALYSDMFTSELIDGNKIYVYFIMSWGNRRYYLVELDENNKAISIEIQ